MRAPTPIPAPILEPKVLRHLQPAINAYFDFRENESCFELYGIIANFISDLCDAYDREILLLVNNRTDGKTVDDWVSWYVEIFKIIQTATIDKLADHISRKEHFDLTIKQRLPCQSAKKYAGLLGRFYSDAYDDYMVQVARDPLSRKHQKKKQSRKYAAYDLEFIPCRCGPAV